MGQLIEDLLKLSRVSRSELDRMEVDLSSLCGKILDDLARANPERRVDSSIQPGLSVQADPRLLRVALENLLGNAWKFTSQREIARIVIGVTPLTDGKQVFFVQDNGAGFDMQYAEKLFDAFQRLHTSKEFEGTGIGLAIVQRIIHRHGGRIWAEAETGKGTCIFFTLNDRGDA
jgi:light-regulated signal transduction histidine kinase (bacteriophytochrome)